MPDNDSGDRSGLIGISRTQRSPGQEGHSAGFDAYEAGQRRRVAQREAHRKALVKGPALKAEELLSRLPEPIFKHLSVDDVCRETMLIADLLGASNVVLT